MGDPSVGLPTGTRQRRKYRRTEKFKGPRLVAARGARVGFTFFTHETMEVDDVVKLGVRSI